MLLSDKSKLPSPESWERMEGKVTGVRTKIPHEYK